MIIDALQRLTHAGFQISDYQYTGFGSYYFVDFILFHKFLGFRHMLSVEHDQDLKSRGQFNKPFDFVKIRLEPVSSVIPVLSRDRKHFLWLDYDRPLWREHLSDIHAAMTYLPPGSIILITVDVEPSELEPDQLKAAKYSLPRAWKTYYEQEASEYLPSGLRVRDFAKSELALLNQKILRAAILRGLAGRTDVRFLPLLHFLYRDGSSQMLTLGGMIATSEDERRVRGSTLTQATYARLDVNSKPYEIRVPKLTRKERLYLDCAMPCSDKWKPRHVKLDSQIVLEYRELYRFLPAYAEILL